MSKRIAPFLLAIAGAACSSEPSGAIKQLEAQAREEEQKKQARAEAEAVRKKEQEALVDRLLEARRPLDASFSKLWDALPDPKTLSRKPCPDREILAETPDEAGRSVLLFNKESLYLLTGRADGKGGAIDNFHTPAMDHGLSLRRPGGKETPLLERAAGDTAEKLQAQLDAVAYVERFRYVGVGVFTAYLPADLAAKPRPKPTRVEGWLVVMDRKTNRALCQVESAGEGLLHQGTVNTDSAGDEEAWGMFVYTSGKNIEAISKALRVEGGPKKRGG